MIQSPNGTVRIVIGVLVFAIVLYIVSLSLSGDRVSLSVKPTATIQGLESEIASLELDLVSDYIELTRLYLSEGNMGQAIETINEGSTRFPNNSDLLRLQSDLQSNY